MTVKHNNSLNLITGCLYIRFFGLHVSVIPMTIIRSVRAKEIAMQQKLAGLNPTRYVRVFLRKSVIKTTPRRYNTTIPYFKYFTSFVYILYF